jgi:hypothetical protein
VILGAFVSHEAVAVFKWRSVSDWLLFTQSDSMARLIRIALVFNK